MPQQKKLATNIFKKIDNDAIPEASKPMFYEMALNAVKRSNEGDVYDGLVNEGSTFDKLIIPGTIVGHVLIETRNWLLVILKSGDIGYYDTSSQKYERVYNLNDLSKNSKNACSGADEKFECAFDFSDCEEIKIDYNFWNKCNELHIVFSYKCTFYTVNIDELRDEKRAKRVTCGDIQTFKCECIPTVRPATVEGGGGAGLPNGKYRFCVQLINKDGHVSNYFNISKEVFVGGDRNIPGEISSEYINVWITGLSCHYSSLNLVVIKSVGSGAKAQKLDRIDFGGSGITFEYRGDIGNEVDIPLQEILTRRIGYLKGREVKIFDGHAFYAQIKNDNNYHIQRTANVATLGLDVYKVPADIAHHYPSLQPGERYLFGGVGQYCDGTETAVGVFSDAATLESRGEDAGAAGGANSGNEKPPSGPSSGGGNESPTVNPASPGKTPGAFEGNERPPTTPGGGGGPTGSGDGGDSGSGGSGGETDGGASGGGNGSINHDNELNDEYVDYKNLPPGNKRAQEDGYYTDGCVTGGATCEPFGKAISDALEGIADGLPDDTDEAGSEGDDCIECGDPTKPKGFLAAIKKALSIALFGPWSVGNSKNRKNKKAPRTANGLKSVLQGLLNEAKEEEVYLPVREKVKVTNSKKDDGGPAADVRKDGDIGGQWDNLNIYKVGRLEPKWVDSEATYPMTLDCDGGYIYGIKAGKPVRLLEVPLLKFYESASVGAKSSKLMSVDETSGYVYLVGLSVRNFVLEDGPKPWCENQPAKIVMRPCDEMNRRVLGCGIGIHTYAGEANGRVHAVPKMAVNAGAYIDRHIQTGGDDHVHTGTAHGRNIYVYFSPDTMLGHPLLTATHFLKLGDVSGDGWRHGQYAETNKKVGFFERREDQKGTRETVNLHTMTFAPGQPIKIQGIGYAKGDSVVAPPRGIELPLLNLNREKSVWFQLASSLGDYVDRSVVLDGLDHAALVYDAKAPIGYLIREMPRQYGSLVGAKYVDVGLYFKKGETAVAGLVGDSFAGPISVRRTNYVSNLVGDTTFIPSPRKTKGIFRFFGFGDPTEPPESGDTQDPKNRANRFPGMKSNAAAAAALGGGGTNSLYYPKVLKCLVYFWAQSRVNAHYRQRGSEELGEVHSKNLGQMYLDSDTPKGTPWEKTFMNRFFGSILRESRFHSVLRPAIRIGVIVGILIWFVTNGFKVHGNLDLFLGYWIRIAIFLIVWVLLFVWVLTVSRINRMMGLEEQLNDLEGGADKESVVQWEDQFTKYSAEYNVNNNLGSSIGITDPFNVCVCNNCVETDFSKYKGNPGINNRIYYTPRQYQNTEINAFKNVLMGDYGEMPTNSGQLQTLISLNNMLYAVCTDGWYRLSYNGNVNYRGVEYLLGNGQALGTPHRISDGPREGVFGCIDPNSISITPAGAVFVDSKANIPYLFDGAKMHPLIEGVNGLMDNYLDFCTTGCRDQKNSGHWYTWGYDPEFGRLLLTKNDKEKSWTLSYCLKERGWVSAHSYVPNFYFWDRGKMFSVKKNEIWRHNSKDSKQMFYDQYAPFTVWFNTTVNGQSEDHFLDFQIAYIELHTIANDLKGNTRNRHLSFNIAGWNNSYQVTGVHLLDTSEYKCEGFSEIRERAFVEKLERAAGRGIWRLNAAFKDRITNVDSAILKQDDCQFFKNFDDSNVSIEGDGNRSVMADYYLRSMYSLNDPSLSHIELKLLRSIVYGNQSEE